MNAFEVIKTVRLTEKGTRQGEKFNQYTVVADRRANKTEIRQAVQELFKVKVTKVNTLNVRGKSAPPAHLASRQGARLEESHRDAQGRRQDCFDVDRNLKSRPARKFFRAFLFSEISERPPSLFQRLSAQR